MGENENVNNQTGDKVAKIETDVKPSEEPSEWKIGSIKINRNTLSLKVTLFLYYGAMAAILPYLTIHMKEIGISIKEVATIYAVLPLTSFIGPPILGLLADKLGEYKTVLILSTVFNGLFHTLLLAVPSYKEIPMIVNVSFKADDAISSSYIFPQEEYACPEFREKYFPYQDLKFNLHDCVAHTDEHMLSELSIENENLGSEQKEMVENCFFSPLGNQYRLICNSIEEEAVQTDGSSNYTSDMQVLDLTDTFFGNDSCRMPVSIDFEPYGSRFITCATNLFVEVVKIEGSNSLTFWLYFILRLIATIAMHSCFSLLDATTLSVVNRNGKAEYGKERIFSICGLALISPLAGILVDQASKSKGYTDYSFAFYVSDALLIANIISYFILHLDVEKPESGVWKNAKKLFMYPEVVVFLVMIFVLGAMWGFVESYLFIFLKELNAPNWLLGVTLTVGSVTGFPFLYGAEKIVKKIGRINVIILAFIVYFLRFFGYSYIPNAFWCFPFEMMEAFTYHLMWTAAATYCNIIAPKGLLATLTGIMGSLHYSLGKGSGAFVGGHLFGSLGPRLSFRYFGFASGVVGIVYAILYHFWLKAVIKKRVEAENEQVREEVGKELLNVPFDGNQRRPSVIREVVHESDFIEPMLGENIFCIRTEKEQVPLDQPPEVE